MVEDAWFDRAVRAWQKNDRAAAYALLDEGRSGFCYAMGYLGNPEDITAATLWWREVENRYEEGRRP